MFHLVIEVLLVVVTHLSKVLLGLLGERVDLCVEVLVSGGYLVGYLVGHLGEVPGDR